MALADAHEGRDPTTHSWARVLVDWMVNLWHFLVPVLDDVTDVLLLIQTAKGGYRTLWWICLVVLAIADAERVYALVYVVAMVMSVGASVSLWLTVVSSSVLLSFLSWLFSLCHGECRPRNCLELMRWFPFKEAYTAVWTPVKKLGGDQPHEWPYTKWLFLDAVTWALLGSRSRTSAIMSRYGFAGEGSADELERIGLALRGIDKFLQWHPYGYLGRIVFLCPHYHHIPAADRSKESRRAMAIVRAVGETLVVDSLFLALGIVASGWDGTFSGITSLSALFSILELVTELQYYICEAEKYMVPGEALIADRPEVGREMSGSDMLDSQRSPDLVQPSPASRGALIVRELQGPWTRKSVGSVGSVGSARCLGSAVTVEVVV